MQIGREVRTVEVEPIDVPQQAPAEPAAPPRSVPDKTPAPAKKEPLVPA